MTRGTNKQAAAKARSGGLAAYVKPTSSEGGIGSSPEYVDWSEVPQNLLAHAIWAAVKLGGALTFGANRKGDCYAITVHDSGDRNTYYWHCSPSGFEELCDWLELFVHNVEQAS